jgi:transcriptional regulator with XRE-family HTH domain
MCRKDTVKPSLQGQINLKNAREEAGLSQQSLADQLGISVDTIKRLEGTKDPDKNPAVKRETVEKIAKVLNLQPTNIVAREDWLRCPDDFRALILEKTKNFCGRELVFQRFEQFCQEKSNGYFTVVGDAGMGKSSIAAKYVLETGAICHFNVMAEGRSRADFFLKSIRQQLIERYNLDKKAEGENLEALLTKARGKLGGDEPIIIIVDALDEVEDDRQTHNVLNLPKHLPEGVYFFLTRRSYSQGQKRLVVEVPCGELDLSNEADAEIKKMNRDDIKAYIRLFLEEDPEHKDKLQEWINARQIGVYDFVELLTKKSEYNFMYLRYVLPAIANGDYRDFSIKELPEGLQQYYEQHWQRMEMDGKNRPNGTLLSILITAGTPVSCKLIAETAGRDEYEVLEVLEKWRGFLKKVSVEGQECYAAYHYTFAEFLGEKPAIKREAAKLLAAKNNRIREALAADEGEADEEE